MTLRYLVNRRRKQYDSVETKINSGLVSDAIINMLQPMHLWEGKEIKEVEITEVIDDQIKLKIYLAKAKGKK